MAFVSSTRFSILINGKSTEAFHPSRGLRQGCPLSPYLFLLCSQGLSSLLHRQSDLGNLCRVRCARNALAITHLFFADDTLLFGNIDLNNFHIISEVLKSYEAASGQAINLKQSCITFSPNTSCEMKDLVFSSLNMLRNESFDAYIGLSAFTGRNKQRVFDGIKEKVWNKLQGWKWKLFSMGGREILINAVAHAIPAYSMSIFRLPTGLCNRLRSMIVKFWWSGKMMIIVSIGKNGRCYVDPEIKEGWDLDILLHLISLSWLNKLGESSRTRLLWRQGYIKWNTFPMGIFLMQKLVITLHCLEKLDLRQKFVGKRNLMEGWQWYKHSGVQWSMATETSLFQTITIPTPNQKNLMVSDLLLRMVNVIGTKWKTCCGISIMHNWGVFIYVELMVMTYWFGILIQQVNLQWGRGIILQWQKMNQEVMVYNVVLLGSWRKCGIFGYQTESKFISGVCYSMRSQLVSKFV